MKADVELDRVTKSYGSGPPAVDDFSLQITSGELVSLLGPSGCGKTTTLRMVGGFVIPDSGRVRLKGADVTDRPPNKRDVGMLFQSYALFPHMTVAGNVGYGLQMRKVRKDDLKRRVAEALDLVRLGEFAERYPRQLSGGQQQRVALARAIVIRPAVLLLDEPLSNLDAKLRQEMRREIRQLQRHVGITTLFVTHDQEEALTISDRIVVMNRGRIEQSGTPAEIYRTPRSLFVAQFIGDTNVLVGRVESSGPGKVRFLTKSGHPLIATAATAVVTGAAATVALRPEAIRIFAPGDPRAEDCENRRSGRIEGATYLGPSVTLHVRLAGDEVLNVTRPSDGGEAAEPHASHVVGEAVVVGWRAESARLIEAP